MGPFVIAWLLGEGIIAYRTVSRDHLPPSPGRLLASSGLFALLAIVAKLGPPQAKAATLAAFGFDIAAILQVPLTNAGATAKGKAATFPPAGGAGNLQVFPDGGPGGAASAQQASTAASSGPVNTSGVSGGSGAAANQQAAQQIIQKNSQFSGWDTGQQWQCLVNLWNQESGWSSTAVNPSSGATGIPQLLPSAHAVPPNWQDPAVQLAWGLDYILGTYGTPCGAWAHEQSHNWY